MFSVIIPAHNEEAVIGRALRALTHDVPPGALEVIVACNGCTDRTAALARGFGGPVRVVETATPSKTAALNLGDDAARGFPRFYVDADVELSWPGMQALAAALAHQSSYLAAAPAVRMELGGASLPVRQYYYIWTRMPFFSEGMVGSGVYVLSAAGRQRFDRFPPIIADDGYVRLLFAPHERVCVPAAEVVVRAPASFWGLIKIKTRSRLGRYELHRRYPELLRNLSRGPGFLRYVATRPWVWPHVPAYLVVNLISHLRAKAQLKRLAQYRWERDDSSRAPA